MCRQSKFGSIGGNCNGKIAVKFAGNFYFCHLHSQSIWRKIWEAVDSELYSILTMCNIHVYIILNRYLEEANTNSKQISGEQNKTRSKEEGKNKHHIKQIWEKLD